MAPELFEDEDAIYGASVDVYAFGITAYQIMTGENPWNGNFGQIMKKVTRGVRPNFNSKVSEKMKKHITRC